MPMQVQVPAGATVVEVLTRTPRCVSLTSTVQTIRLVPWDLTSLLIVRLGYFKTMEEEDRVVESSAFFFLFRSRCLVLTEIALPL